MDFEPPQNPLPSTSPGGQLSRPRTVSSMNLKQIPKAALMPEAVYQQLKTAILTGVFRPGQTLRQEDVARQLGVSRGPLREALPKLEAEGMIIATPHRGCTVVSLAPAEIMEIFELRAMLEASLAKVAARKKEPEAVRRLREIASTMRSLEVSANAADQQRWFDLNYELHEILLDGRWQAAPPACPADSPRAR